MSANLLFILNGKLTHVNDPIPASTILNRGMYYGDGFFDTQFFDYRKKGIRFWELHKKRLEHSFSVMHMQPIPDLVDPERYKKLIKPLVENVLSLDHDLVLRVQVWREGEKGYRTDSNKASYIIECSTLPKYSNSISVKTLASEYIFRPGISPMIKTSSAVGYVLSSFTKKNKEEELLLINAEGMLLEGLSSSLFWIKNGVVYTTLNSQEIHDGVSRMFIPNLLNTLNIKFEYASIALTNLVDMDAVFVSNSLKPIRQVNAINKLPIHTNSALLDKLIQEFGSHVSYLEL